MDSDRDLVKGKMEIVIVHDLISLVNLSRTFVNFLQHFIKSCSTNLTSNYKRSVFISLTHDS